MLSEVDLPPVVGVDRPWIGTEARVARTNLAATRCDATRFDAKPMKRNMTRTFVIPGARLSDLFGLTETVGQLTEKQARSFVAGVRTRLRTCADRELGSDVVRVADVSTRQQDLTVWHVTTEISDEESVTYLMGIVRDGGSVAQVGFVPDGKVQMAPGRVRLAGASCARPAAHAGNEGLRQPSCPPGRPTGMTPWSATSLALVPLLLVGCGTATSAPSADDPEPTPSPSLTSSPASPATSPSSPETSSPVRPLEHFPLARGYPETNGDDGSPVVVTAESGVEALSFCRRVAWSPELRSRPWTSSGRRTPERPRTSAVARSCRYAEEALAAQALASLRLAVEQCPEEEVGGTAQVYAGADRHAGDEAFTITHRYRAEYGFDTGLEVIDAVRVGDLVLLSWDYGEGGGSDESIRRSRREVTDQSDALVPDLGEYAIRLSR